MVADALQWGALGLLAVVLVGLGIGAKLLVTRILGPFVDALLNVGRDNVDTNRALREAMVSQGQRLATVEQKVDALAGELETVGDMVLELHGSAFGSKRTSQYERERAAEKAERARKG